MSYKKKICPFGIRITDVSLRSRNYLKNSSFYKIYSLFLVSRLNLQRFQTFYASRHPKVLQGNMPVYGVDDNTPS